MRPFSLDGKSAQGNRASIVFRTGCTVCGTMSGRPISGRVYRYEGRRGSV